MFQHQPLLILLRSTFLPHSSKKSNFFLFPQFGWVRSNYNYLFLFLRVVRISITALVPFKTTVVSANRGFESIIQNQIKIKFWMTKNVEKIRTRLDLLDSSMTG